MKVVIIGANGQLGSDICKSFENKKEDVVALTHDIFEVSDIDSVATVLRQAAPDLVINTAAMHNVETCEDDPLKSFLVNGVGARNLAVLSNEVEYTIMHISTDYVFDGSKRAPYIETDSPIPLNVYGNTKLSGELFIRSIAHKYFILRVSGIYGLHPCRAKGGRNFVTTMLKLAKERDEIRVVNDEILSPTYTGDVAHQIMRLAECDCYGLYHVAAQGHCSWYEFAAKIFELTNTSVRLSVADPNEFPMKVPRPKYSVLENKALKTNGLDLMPHWIESLQNYVNST